MLVPVSQNVFGLTETVFDEDFDGAIAGWTESLCDISDPSQTCSIGQATELLDPPNDPPTSLPNWGFVEITAIGIGGSATTPVEIRYQESFFVTNEDDYDVRAFLGIKDCNSCHMSTRLYVDGVIVLEKIGPDTQTDPVGPHKFFEQSMMHLTPGSHTIELGMFSTGAGGGQFRASFDDIQISRDVPIQCGDKTELNSENECVPDLNQICGTGTIPDFDVLMCFGLALGAVGGMILEIDTWALFVANIGVNPVITGLVGITLTGVVGQAVWYIHKRRNSKNS